MSIYSFETRTYYLIFCLIGAKAHFLLLACSPRLLTLFLQTARADGSMVTNCFYLSHLFSEDNEYNFKFVYSTISISFDLIRNLSPLISSMYCPGRSRFSRQSRRVMTQLHYYHFSLILSSHHSSQTLVSWSTNRICPELDQNHCQRASITPKFLTSTSLVELILSSSVNDTY